LLSPCINFIKNVYAHFFARKTKKLLVFKNKFHHTFSYKNCAGCAIRKAHLGVLVAIRKSQLAVLKKALKKLRVKMLMKLTPGGSKGSGYICNFCLLKDKIVNSSTTMKAREKINTDLESIQVLKYLHVEFTKYKIFKISY
jgi:hypothetical protein